jgi:hypothetical protein
MNFDYDLEQITPKNTDSLLIAATGAFGIPAGTTAQRPVAPPAGSIRFNTDTQLFEEFDTVWRNIGTVTSVATTAPAAGLTISGGTITEAGTLTFALANDLAAVEGLATTGLAVRTDVDTWATRTVTGTAGNVTITNGDGVAGNPTIDLAALGTPVTASMVKVTTDAYGRVTATTPVTQSDISSSLGFTPVNIAGDTMTGPLVLSADAVSGLQAATLQQVQSLVSSAVNNRDDKQSVRVASSTNITLTAPGATIDGITMATGERFLALGQTNGAQNGIYVYNGALTAATRASDADTSAEVTAGLTTFVSEGTSAGSSYSIIGTDPIVLDTTSLTFAQTGSSTPYTGANGVSVSGTVIETEASSSLRSLHTLATNGMLAQTAAGTVAARTISGPSSGVTVANGDGVAGNPTISLANDLAAVEGLTTTGVAVRTGVDTWTTRTTQGTASQVTVTNGDGVSGDPTISLASDVVLPGTIGVTLPSGTNAQETGTTDGQVRYNTTTNRARIRQGGVWADVGTGDGSVTSVAVTGSTGLDVTGGPVTSAGTFGLTLGTELQALSALSADGIVVRNGAAYASRALNAGTGISITNANGTGGNPVISNTGVTSVALELPTMFAVTGSPVTTTGTLTAELSTQAAATVFAGPTSGGSATPTFRALAVADLPIALYRENPNGSVVTPIATGANSYAQGSGSKATGLNTVATGAGTDARLPGGNVYANGAFTSAGDAQIGQYVMRNITTDDTASELFLDGAAAQFVLQDNSAVTFELTMTALRTDASGGAASYMFVGGIRRDTGAASTTITGSVSKVIVAETNAQWGCDVVADTTTGALKVVVTGQAAKTIRWVARLDTVEVLKA